MPISGDVIHTVNFFQGAFTIILSLSLGEALKSFASDNHEHSLRWDRTPALLAFFFIFFPFFQSMSQYLYVVYLNPQTALKFYPAYLMFDGIMFTLQAACFFVMSRSLAPQIWRRFYTAVLILTGLDIAWTGVSYLRGVDVGAWLLIDCVIVAAVLAMLWFERGRQHSMRATYIGLAVVTITTALSYWIEADMYLP